MCYSSGSIDQAVNPCPMCKVYKNSRCPHVRDICRNRALHPRMEVTYLKNAEVDCFNGCGFCKWATHDPKSAGYNNPGWPGCCRPPSASEQSFIQVAEWEAVSIVHQVPIPSHIESVLEAFSIRTIPLLPPTGLNRTPSKQTNTPRKNSGATAPSSKSNVLSTKAMNTPSQRGRSPQVGTPPSVNISRSSSSTQISSSVPSPSTVDHLQRRKISTSEKRVEGVHSSNSSPSRKSIDLENPSHARRAATVRRPTVTPATPSVSLSKVFADVPPTKRRSSVSGSTAASASPSTPARSTERSTSFIAPRSSRKDDDCSASTSSGSSDGLGSMSDSTITSDGGFTDYLSDESEAELQRQAEAKAALQAQMQAEELEFRMARQQLTHIGLSPPKTWNPTNGQDAGASGSPSKSNGNGYQASRSARAPTSFGAAAAAMVQSAQVARG